MEMEMETEMETEMEMEMEMEMQTHSSLSLWLAVPVIARSTSALKVAVPFEFCCIPFCINNSTRTLDSCH